MRKRKNRTITHSLVCLSCAVAACIAGCGHKANERDVFRFNLASGLGSLDPAQMSTIASREIGMQIFDGLVRLDTSGNVVPDIAKRWAISDDETTWRFVLRAGARFQNDDCFPAHTGRIATARDVKFSFERICDPGTKSTGWWIFHDVVAGADDFHDSIERGLKPSGVAGFEAPDDTTFVVHLERPLAPFLSILAMPYCSIIPHEAVERYAPNFFRHPVGTGAFTLERWTPDVELVLKRNPFYWDSSKTGNIQTAVVSFERDVKTEFLEFKKGNFDVAGAIPPGFENAVFDESGNLQGKYKQYTLLSLPSLTSEYYGILLDTTEAAARSTPLAVNLKLRQALNYAINRDAIVRYVLRSQAVPAKGVLPPGVAGYDSNRTAYTYDPAKARTLLAEAGFPAGRGLPPLTLELGQSEQTVSVAEAVQQQLKQAGVELRLQQVDFPQHLAMVRDGNVSLWRTQWIADYCDAQNFLALFSSANFSPGGPNTTHFANATFDSLYAFSLRTSSTETQRTAAYKRMDSLVLANAPWIFLYYPKTTRLLQPEVETFACDPLGYFRLSAIVKRDG